jgi:hypothetical protein
VNFIPSSVALESFSVTVPGVCDVENTLQHLAVVNDQLNADAITFPELSFAPLTLAVYDVPAARAALGWNVAVWFESV